MKIYLICCAVWFANEAFAQAFLQDQQAPKWVAVVSPLLMLVATLTHLAFGKF